MLKLKLTVTETALIKFLLFIALLIAVRIYVTGSNRYIFLLWNLFLAAVPLLITKFFPLRTDERPGKQWLLLAIWLLFFPNALYIVTDCIHLQTASAVPKWFDALLLFSSALAGLLMGFVSLYKVERFLAGLLKGVLLKISIGFIIFLGAFGVYLGRFLRWNSWDVVSNPLDLFGEIIARIFFPFQHLQTWGVTFLLAAFYLLLYSFLKSFSRLEMSR